MEWRLERAPAWLVRAVPIDLRELAPIDKRLVRDAEIAPSVCLRLILAVMCEKRPISGARASTLGCVAFGAFGSLQFYMYRYMYIPGTDRYMHVRVLNVHVVLLPVYE